MSKNFQSVYSKATHILIKTTLFCRIMYYAFSYTILVAVEGTTYTYITGVDRQNVLLLCAPMDGGSLDLMWNSTLTNPVNISSEISRFETDATEFNCTRDTTTIVTTYISVIS